MDKLNFDSLKGEALVEKRNDFPAKVNFGKFINTPLLKMLFDYFNVLRDKKDMQEKHGFKVLSFLGADSKNVDNLPQVADGSLNYKAIVEYGNEFNITIIFQRYKEMGEWHSTLAFTSNIQTYVSADFIYKKIIYNAIAHSDLKGSYFIMPDDNLSWNIRELSKRGFDDIYLPETIMKDLRLYTTLFEKKEELMRFLFAGTPGTGKTEATLAIANVLKDMGVTIIKTKVCNALKEKIELAELLAPSMIILDDLDLSLGSRTKGGSSAKLGIFLDALDGTDKISKQVGIIATTNSIQLLDMAAQRPGRFDKIMSFEELEKDNIKNIILKSLKFNFEIPKSNVIAKTFTDKRIIDIFFDSRLTGSHVYFSVQMIMRCIETLDMIDYDVEWIISEIENDVKTRDNIRNAQFLRDGKLKGNGSDEVKGFKLEVDENESSAGFQYDEELEDEGENEESEGGLKTTPTEETDQTFETKSDEELSDFNKSVD